MIKGRELKIFLFMWAILIIFLYIFKNYSILIRIASFIFGFLIFYFFDKAFDFEFKKIHYFYAFIVLTFGILLSPLYYLFPIYDKTLHLILPIFGSIVLFYMLDWLNIDFKYKIIFTLCILVSILAVFEIGEYLLEQFLGMEIQGVYIRDYTGIAKLKIIQDKNEDTMIDLILGIAGTLIFIAGKSIFYFYNKRYSKIKRV